MNRKIEINFVDEGVSAKAELLWDQAPRTSECIWNLLETPVENLGIHAMWTGREISFPIPHHRFGTITENLDEFAAVCARCQSEGKKKIRLSRY
jgi:hypothetical protein